MGQQKQSQQKQKDASSLCGKPIFTNSHEHTHTHSRIVATGKWRRQCNNRKAREDRRHEGDQGGSCYLRKESGRFVRGRSSWWIGRPIRVKQQIGIIRNISVFLFNCKAFISHVACISGKIGHSQEEQSAFIV